MQQAQSPTPGSQDTVRDYSPVTPTLTPATPAYRSLLSIYRAGLPVRPDAEDDATESVTL